MNIHSASIQLFHCDANIRKTFQLFSFVLKPLKKIYIHSY